MLRGRFERLLAHWEGPALRVRYWDGTERIFGVPPAVFTVTIRNPRVLLALAARPSLAFGEAYMRGELEVEGDLAQFIGSIPEYARRGVVLPLFSFLVRLVALARTISREQAVRNARHHYDVGNAFYRLWLDPTLTYSCAFFRTSGDDLATAQQQKLEYLCRKLHLERGQTLLDIGCGWGSLLFHAVERYGVSATGITPSEEQCRFVQSEIERRGLQGRCAVRLLEWRECEGTYDRVVSVGMFEHVGRAHYRAFLQMWQRLLKRDGVSVLHTIGGMRETPTDPWIRTYIFPGAELPSLGAIVRSVADANLDIRDVENLRSHYALTLEAWSRAFQEHLRDVVKMYGEAFARMWWLYLQGTLAGFRSGGLCLWQIILTKDQTVSLPLTREHLFSPFPRPLADS